MTEAFRVRWALAMVLCGPPVGTWAGALGAAVGFSLATSLGLGLLAFVALSFGLARLSFVFWKG